MAITLRPYQERLIDKIREAFENGCNSVMAVASTGAGKTIMFSYIAEHAAKLGNRVFIIVHRKELIRQTSKSLTFNDIPHGIIAAGHRLTDTLIQVCSLQTLVARLMRFDFPELLVVDEGHHILAKTYLKVIAWAIGVPLIAFTATPIRADGKSFATLFDTMVESDNIQQLIADGWLVQPEVFAPPIEDLDLSGLKEGSNGDFVQKEIDEKIDKPKIIGSAVAHYKRLFPHYPPAVAFCTSVKNAEHVAEEFRANGIPAASIDGSMDDETRADLVEALKVGTIKVLTSCDLISEGFDLPAIEVIIMLRPIGKKCLSTFMQQVGRVLRPCEGKLKAYILDHVENWKRHGFVEDVRDWWEGFNGRPVNAAAKKSNLIKCPKCYAIFPKAANCPRCGQSMAPKREGAGGNGREIEEVEGELVKLDKAALFTFRSTGANGGRKKTEIRRLERA